MHHRLRIHAMAIDFNSVKFLFWARNLGVSFNRTLTLGRLGLSCAPGRVKRAVDDFNLADTEGEIDRCFKRTFNTALFADDFLQYLGAKELVSVDRSDYEGATLLQDLNEPFPANLRGHFDLVLDGGTLEHIFDFPSALQHCLEVISVGGHFLTMTPTSGWMGHGFYQFSPELFFRIFNPENGFELRKIFLFDCLKADADFYEVKDPALLGGRVQLSNARPFLLGVLARKTAEVPLFVRPPQQSDYVALWKDHEKKPARVETGNPSLFRRFRMAVHPYWPYWLRYWKARFLDWREHGSPTLRNTKQFRRLSREEITRERGQPPVKRT
jgi:hypothetical protein